MDVTAADRELASTIGLTRQGFERLFSQVRPPEDDIELIALPEGPVGTEELFALGFAYMRSSGWLTNFIAACVTEGVVNTPFAKAAALAGQTIGKSLLQTLQSVEGLADTGSFVAGLGRAIRQVCRIDIDGRPVGTGFLLKADVVLTAYHVIRELLNENGRPQDDSHLRLTAVFDAYTRLVKGRHVPNTGRPIAAAEEGWLLGFSKNHPSEDLGQLPDPLTDLADHFDYALIRLGGAAGINLMGFEIERQKNLTLDKTIFIFQHAGGRPQQFDQAQVTKILPGGFRFEHTVSTEGGSSGSPCVDRSLRVVGIHQAGGKNGPGFTEGHTSANRGVPVSAFLSVLQGLPDPDPRLFPLVELTHAPGYPVIGRRQTQNWIWQAVGETDKPILTVTGPTHSGKSFTHEIARSLLPAAEHMLVKFGADDFATNTPHEFAQNLLAALDLPKDGLGADDANLMRDLTAALKQGRKGRMIWITLDNLDKADIPESGGLRDLLSKLYGLAKEENWLRFFLLGYEGTPSLELFNLIARETLGPAAANDVADYARLRIGPHEGEGFFKGITKTAPALLKSVDQARGEAKLAILAGLLGESFGD